MTHAVLSPPSLARLQASPLERLVVTDTLPLPPGADTTAIEVVSVAPLLGEAIRRIHTGQSVGALFR